MSAIAGRLQVKLDRGMSWRRRELSHTYTSIPDDSVAARLYGRKAILLLYSHVEGFVEGAANDYLDAIRAAAVPPADLSDHLFGLCIHGRVSGVINRNDISGLGLFARSIKSGQGGLMLPSRGIVRTKSNLSANRFKGIVLAIGLTADRYNQMQLNDLGRLLRIRNSIAHGEGVPVDAETYQQLHHRVIDIMDLFKDHLLAAAESEAYLH